MVYPNASVSKPFPIWVVFRNNPRWEPPTNQQWSKTDLCWTRAEAEVKAQELRASSLRAAIVRVEVPPPKGLDATRKKIATEASGGSVTWPTPVRCGACKKQYTGMPLLCCGADNTPYEFCPSCSDELCALPRGDDTREDVDRLIARKRRRRKR